MSNLKTFEESTFDQDVLESGGPVLVDFYADWCGPCKMMTPVIEQIAQDYDGRVTVGKLDVDAAQATFQQGVLRLTFPRAEAARPRRVPITASGQAAFGPAPSAEPVADGTAPSADREATQATNGKATTGKAASGKRVSGRAAGRKTGDTRVSVGA